MRVLLAIDGSDNSQLATDFVAAAAWPAGTRIVVAEAVESGVALFGGPWPALTLIQTDDIEAAVRDQALRTVNAAAALLQAPGRTIETMVLGGRAATAIVAHARAMAADLVVVGSRGHGTIESMLLGSVSAEVIDHSPVPVLVARGAGTARIVFGWDGSDCAKEAAGLVRSWPIFRDSTVRVTSVGDNGIPWWTGFPEAGSPELMPMYVDATDASRKHAEQIAHEMAADLNDAGLAAHADVRMGDGAVELLAAAEDVDADLIVVGTHGRTGLARLVLGSVARNVVHHATCSVLVVRGRAAEGAAGAAGGDQR